MNSIMIHGIKNIKIEYIGKLDKSDSFVCNIRIIQNRTDLLGNYNEWSFDISLFSDDINVFNSIKKGSVK